VTAASRLLSCACVPDGAGGGACFRSCWLGCTFLVLSGVHVAAPTGSSSVAAPLCMTPLAATLPLLLLLLLGNTRHKML